MASRRSTLVFIILLTFIAFLVVSSSLLLIRVGARAADISRTEGGGRYKWHLMMIGERTDSPFWQEVFVGAREAGEANAAIVEMIGPKSDADIKATDEYIDYAIAARANGILAFVSDDEETVTTLGRARESGIPVITLDNDSIRGPRQSFVGVSSYELGKTLGSLALSGTGTAGSVMILLDKDAVKSSEQIMLTGIHEAVESGSGPDIGISTVSLETLGEEAVRQKILASKNLKTIISLNVEDTMRIVQTLLDLSLNDSVTVIAFRDSPEILEYVRKGLVSAVVVIDARQMGKKAVEAMLEYLDTGNSNDYVITGMHVTTRKTLEAQK